MTTQPQTEAQTTTIRTQTKRVLLDFVRNAVLRLSEKLKESNLEFENDTRWKRGADGHFREQKKRGPRLRPMLSDEWLHSLPDYQSCIECLKFDVVVGPHLDQMVGTWNSASRLEANNILMSLVYATLDDEGRLAFTDERFHGRWRDMLGLFGAWRWVRRRSNASEDGAFKRIHEPLQAQSPTVYAGFEMAIAFGLNNAMLGQS